MITQQDIDIKDSSRETPACRCLDDSEIDAVGGGTLSVAKDAAIVWGAAVLAGFPLIGAAAGIVYMANKEGDGVCFW